MSGTPADKQWQSVIITTKEPQHLSSPEEVRFLRTPTFQLTRFPDLWFISPSTLKMIESSAMCLWGAAHRWVSQESHAASESSKKLLNRELIGQLPGGCHSALPPSDYIPGKDVLSSNFLQTASPVSNAYNSVPALMWAKQLLLVTFWFSSIAQSCPTLCDPMDCSTPGLPVHHQLRELAQTHVHWVSDAIQPSHPLLSPSPPAFSLSQHQGLFWL